MNLLVAENPGDITDQEIMRVLVPNGVAYVYSGGQWRMVKKPMPADTDEWTHYLHSPDNNAVSHDKEVTYPYYMQWVDGPRWTHNHSYLSSYSSVVTSGGRVFSIVNQSGIESVYNEPKWVLLARDAYNGVVLWSKEIGPW